MIFWLQRSSGSTRRLRFGESSDNVAQLSELLAERRFSTQVTLNEIAENENYRFLSRTISTELTGVCRRRIARPRRELF